MLDIISGKIIWVNDDFNYNALSCDTYEHMRMNIENFKISETNISFLIPKPQTTASYHPKDSAYYIDRNFFVNLIPTETSETNFIGTYVDQDNNEYKDRVDWELFYNSQKYFLYGEWYEYNTKYKWWAIVSKGNDYLNYDIR